MSMLSTSPARASTLFSTKLAMSGASATDPVIVHTRLSRQTPSPASSPASSLRSSSAELSKKRKSSPAAPGPLGLPRDVKRLRATPSKGPKRKSSSRSVSRQGSPSPEPIYRSSRSRSTSLFPPSDPETPKPPPRRWRTDEDGVPGPDHLSSEAVVQKLMKSYKTFFRDPANPHDKSFDPHPTDYPVVELEYPNGGASERFILLAPKDKDHYNPIMDLERSLFTIVECYVPPNLQHIFGPIPTATLSDVVSPPASPSPSPPNSNASSSSSSSLSSTSSTIDRIPLLRAVQRAINTQDGPLFLLAMDRINAALHAIKYPPVPTDPFAPSPPNPLMSAVERWTDTGLPNKVLMRIIEENYQRTVGPNVPYLRQYEAFSSTVYGELMPSLAREMIAVTGLNADSLFLDLGSGVGNVVVQASLQTGCTSYGIELMPHPARVAEDVVRQMQIRCRMWGVRVGAMELEQGDMLKSARMDALLAKADVVLVDNKVFEQSLNEALRPKFLDLKEGATVISLSPFVSSINARLTKRNVDDISAIFDVTEKPYHSGSVSWGNNGGSYYLHKVDREGYAKIKERFDRSHNRPRRGARK